MGAVQREKIEGAIVFAVIKKIKINEKKNPRLKQIGLC